MTLPNFDLHFAVLALEWIFVVYFLVAHGGYILLAVASIGSLRRVIRSENAKMLPPLSTGYETPFSIVVPVNDASEDVAQFVHSLFNLDYPEFEVIVAVDGASDDTLRNCDSYSKWKPSPKPSGVRCAPSQYVESIGQRATRNCG